MENDLPSPEFAVGQNVAVVLNDRNRTPHSGQVVGYVWHYKHGRYFYLLIERGNRIKKRYWAEDLASTGV
jgi:hypothetical protein